jgi:hypothetical protein
MLTLGHLAVAIALRACWCLLLLQLRCLAVDAADIVP